MRHLIKVIFIFTFLIVCSCAFNQLNYPYTENNTTVETYFDYQIRDDYQWLEIDCNESVLQRKWLEDQILLKGNFFKGSNQFLESRLEQLSGIPITKTLGIINDTIYFLKLYQSRNLIEFCKFDEKNKDTHLVKSFQGNVYANPDIKASVSASGDKIAIVNRMSNGKNTILIYDLRSDSLFSPDFISDAVNYVPVWIGNGIVFNEYTETGGSRVCYYDISAETPAKSIVYGGSQDDLFVNLDLAIDRKNDMLYISQHSAFSNKEFAIYSIQGKDLISNKEANVFYSFPVGTNQNVRMGGVDDENIYLVDYNKRIRGRVVALNKRNKKCSLLIEDLNVPLSSINLIKDHIVVSFQNMKDNKAYLIHNKNHSVREIGINHYGRYTFVNNKEDSSLYLVEESVIEPKTLFKTTSAFPEKIDLVSRIKNLPFDPDQYITEYVSIENGSDPAVNLVVSYKKGLVMDGKNPAIYYSYPNAGQAMMNPFSFGRILFMEQGFVLVQRNTDDYSQLMSVEDQTKDLFSIVDFLCEQKYSSQDKLCLTGIEIGSTVIANALNKKQNLCRSVIYMDGVFDLVRHHKLDDMQFENSSLFRFRNTEELEHLLSYSPYHNIQPKKSYPSMLLIMSDERKIAPAHSYKYAAKMQMRTKAVNPVIILPPRQSISDNKVFFRDFNYQYYKMLLFLDKTMGLELFDDGTFTGFFS